MQNDLPSFLFEAPDSYRTWDTFRVCPISPRDASGRCTSFALLHADAHLKFDVPGFCRQPDAGRFPSEGPDSYRTWDTFRVCPKPPRGASDKCTSFALLHADAEQVLNVPAF